MLPSLLYKYCYQSEFGLRIRKTVSHLKQGIYSRDFCPVVKTGEEVYEKLLLLCLVLSLQLPGWQMWRNSRCKSITELEATLCHSSLKLPWLFMQVTAGGARILHHRATHKLHGNWGGGKSSGDPACGETSEEDTVGTGGLGGTDQQQSYDSMILWIIRFCGNSWHAILTFRILKQLLFLIYPPNLMKNLPCV